MKLPTKRLLQACVIMQQDANMAQFTSWLRESQAETLRMLVDSDDARHVATLQGEVRAIHKILEVYDTARERLPDFDVAELNGAPPSAGGVSQ